MIHVGKTIWIWEKRILDALGDKVFAIEYIGSTSIKGLQAKPIIDIIVAVQNIDEISNFIHPLSKIEFEYIPKPEFKDRRFFRKGQWGNGTCHLHMCEISSSEWIDKVLFRDYLRLHPEVAEQYASLKKSFLLNICSIDRRIQRIKSRL